MIDRFGEHQGTFTSPFGTPYEQRSLPAGTIEKKPYYVFRVLKSIDGVAFGRIAPWFHQPGGGYQYKLPDSIFNLLVDGYLQVVPGKELPTQ